MRSPEDHRDVRLPKYAFANENAYFSWLLEYLLNVILFVVLYLFLGAQLSALNEDLITNHWDKYCKRHLGMEEFLVPNKLGSDLCETVKEAYIDSSKTFEENKMAHADLMTDATFSAGIYKSSELMSRHSPVYNYLFNYESQELHFVKMFFPDAGKVDGVVAHADDLLYLFKYPHTGWNKENPEYEIVMMMTKIWTDFAKTGEPSISKLDASWPKATWPNHKYVVIDSQPSIQQNYKLDKMKLFEEVYSNSMFKTTFSQKDEL